MSNTELKQHALMLVAINPFMQEDQKKHWTGMVEKMTDEELQKLIEMLEESKKAFYKLIYEAMETDKDGALAKRLADYIQVANKEIDDAEVEKTLNKNLTKI